MKTTAKLWRSVATGLASLLLVACASQVTPSVSLTPQNRQQMTEYREMLHQAKANGSAVCVRYQQIDGRMEQEQVSVPSQSYEVLPEATPDTWVCSDFGEGTFKIVSSARLPDAAVGAAPLGRGSLDEVMGKGLLGLSLEQTKDGRFMRVANLTPGGSAELSGQLRPGDLIIGFAESPESDMQTTNGFTLPQIVAKLRGEPGSFARVMVLPEGGVTLREVTLERREITPEQIAAIQRQKIEALVIKDNSGSYMSPYTSDGVTAEWVDKAINITMGSATGSAVGTAVGSYAANKLLENVPFGGMLGGMLGSKAGKSVGKNTALEASGGWEFIKSSSDLSFRSLSDMARWLVTVHGSNSNLAEVIGAADRIYPGLQSAVTAAAH